MAEFIGSSGTFVGTSLETIGYFYQSYLLDTLGGILTGPVAVFIYVLTAVITLGRYALTGKTRMLGWSLVGPALLAGMLLTRSETRGSSWLFGKQPRSQAQVNYEVNTYLGARETDAPIASVSSFFLTYNRLVSSIMKSFVGVVTSAKSDIDARFLIRAELSTVVRSSVIADSGLRVFLHDTFYRECGDLLDLGKDVTNNEIPQAVRSQRTAEFSQVINRPVPIGGLPKDYLASLLAKYTPLEELAFNRDTPAIAEWLKEKGNDIPGKVTDEGEFTRRKREMITKIENEKKNSLTCAQVWNFVYFGIYEAATRISGDAMKKGESIEEGVLLKDLLMVRISDSPNDVFMQAQVKARHLYELNRVISTYILRNEVNRPSGAAMANNLANKGFAFSQQKVATESDLFHLEKLRLKSQEWGAKTGIIATAANLPYFQGLALYFLSISFPFFCLLLVVPGRQSGFLFWCILWIWTKSWDVGFAIVMQLDDILYSIFTYWGRVGGIYGEASTIGMSPDLADTLNALQTLDPTFNLTTYYSLIGVALTAVPMISSYLILGSVKGGAGLIAEGSQTMSRYFSSKAQAGESQGFVTGSKIEAFDMERQNSAEAVGRLIAGGDGGPNGGGSGFGRALLPDGNGAGSGTAETTPQIPNSQMQLDVNPGGSLQKTSGDNAASDVMRKQQAVGAAEGAAGGLGLGKDLMPGILRSSPGASRAMRNLLDTIGGGIQTWGRVEQALRTAGKDEAAASLKANIDVVAANSTLATFNQANVNRMSSEAGIVGALEIPWPWREGAWRANLNRQIQSLTNRRIVEAAPYKAWEAAISGFEVSSKGLLSAAVATSVIANSAKERGSGNVFDTIAASPLEYATFKSGLGKSERDGVINAELGLLDSDKSKSSSYVYPSNDGVVLFKGRLKDLISGDDIDEGTVVLIRHRNGSVSVYSGIADNDALSVKEGEKVNYNTPIGILKSKDSNLFFKVIDQHFNWLEVKPMFSGLLPLAYQPVSKELQGFIIKKSNAFQPEPSPYVNE